jgi:hypothetical protein
VIAAPATKRLSRENFPSEAEWIEPLLVAFNAQADALAAAVAQLNAQSAEAELSLDIPATYADAFPKLIANPLGFKARHVYATAIVRRDDPSVTVTGESRAVFVEWENSATSAGALQLKIKNVAGLLASNSYRIILKVEA